MRATLLGTGFALPSPRRAQSGLLVETKDNLILFDCGAGVLHRLAQSRHDSGDVNLVFLTHLHLDHCSDLMALLKANWMKGKKNLKIFGPRGTGSWIIQLFEAYPYMKGRIETEVREVGDEGVIRAEGDSIEARKNAHTLESLAYRVTSEGKALVYSGDTAPCGGVKELCARGVDLLIHECSFPDGKTFEDHTTPGALSRLLDGLPVKKVVLTHFSPRAETKLREMKASLEKYNEIIIGEDLMEIRV